MVTTDPTSTSRKVTSLEGHLRKRQGGGAALLDECRRLLTERLVAALPPTLEALDDALFDLAERADSNQQQVEYFEAMREARLKREAIRKGFVQALARPVESVADGARLAAARADDEPALSLVGLEELELDLAVTNMSAKLRAVCQDELYGLDKRVGVLLGRPDLEGERNPLGPQVVCEAFRQGFEALDAGTEVRLIVFKLFDRYVANSLHQVYGELNRHLIRNDVLPQIRAVVRKQPRSPRTTLPPGAIGAMAPGTVPAGSGVVVPLAPGEVPPGAGVPGAGPVGAPAGSAVAAPVAGAPATLAAELLEALRQLASLNGVHAAPAPGASEGRGLVLANLTALQRGDTASAAGAGSALTPEMIASGTGNVLRELKVAQVAAGAERIDELLIDVVAMMFDYILDDESIPDAMKALIGRLQIPVLKVAILDKSLFARKLHPAKQLLNTLAEAAIGWSERYARSDTLYERIEALVRRVLDEFDDDIAIFAEVLDALRRLLDEEAKRSEENTWWTARVVQGRERLAQARARAEAALEGCLMGRPVPPFVREFLGGPWRELLVVRGFREDGDGGAWEEATGLMEELAASAEDQPSPEARKALAARLPRLLERLKAGMRELSMDDDARSEFLGRLAELHLSLIRTGRAPVAPPGAPATDAEATASAAEAPEPAHDAAGTHPEERLVRAAVERANAAVFETAQSRVQCQGMGTTVVVARFRDEHVTVAHVGDSRLYRLRGGRLQQLTADHSLRQSLVERGMYSAEEAAQVVAKNLITRAVGAEREVQVDVQRLYTLPGDLFLACSDGLSDMVGTERMTALLDAHGPDLDAAAAALVAAANEAGGKDNISVALARVLNAFPDDGTGAPPAGQIAMAACCDVGRKRSHNEDAVAASRRRACLVVADGMGGCNAGEVASALAAQVIMEALDGEAWAEEETQELEPPRAEGAEDRSGAINYTAINALFWDEAWPEGETDPQEVETLGDLEKVVAQQADALDDLDLEAPAPAAAATEPEQVESADPISAGYLRVASALRVGSWLEFRQGDGSTTRGRLAWKSPNSGKYLFVDLDGAKVADATPHGLALELRRGSARFVDSAPLFDRAMGSLTERLSGEAGRAA